MVIKDPENNLSAWAFLIGVVLAIFIGLSTTFIPLHFLNFYSTSVYAILVILGLIVGFSTNVAGKDSLTFLITLALLVMVSRFGGDVAAGSIIGIGVGDTIKAIFGALLALFSPATIVVALRTVFSLARV